MGSNIMVALFVTHVLFHEVKVVTANDDGALHLGGLHTAFKDASTDGDVASERALLVNIFAVEGLLRCLDIKANILGVSHVGSLQFLSKNTFAAEEDGGLLLESPLRLLSVL